MIPEFKFYGEPEPDDVVEFSVSIEVAYSKIPEHWRQGVPHLKVFITNLSEQDFSHKVTVLQNEEQVIIFPDYISEPSLEKKPEDLFLFYFCKIFVHLHTQIKDIVAEYATKAGLVMGTVDDDGETMIQISPLQAFIMFFPSFILEKKSMHPKAQWFMLQIDQWVKDGNLVSK